MIMGCTFCQSSALDACPGLEGMLPNRNRSSTSPGTMMYACIAACNPATASSCV